MGLFPVLCGRIGWAIRSKDCQGRRKIIGRPTMKTELQRGTLVTAVASCLYICFILPNYNIFERAMLKASYYTIFITLLSFLIIVRGTFRNITTIVVFIMLEIYILSVVSYYLYAIYESYVANLKFPLEVFVVGLYYPFFSLNFVYFLPVVIACIVLFSKYIRPLSGHGASN